MNNADNKNNPSSRVSPFLTGSPLDFIYQARDPRKRQVKPVDKHYELMQLAANLEGGDSSDDEEYVPKELDDDDDDEDDDDANNDDAHEDNDADSNDDDDDDEDDSSSDDGANDNDSEKGNDTNKSFDGDSANLKNVYGDSLASFIGDNLNAQQNDNNERQQKIPSPSKNKIGNNDTNNNNTTSATTTDQPGSPNKSALVSNLKICSVCLGDHSRGDDEIIECDSCGIPVHESCYGVSHEDENDNQSVHSNISSESTEPWFCEPCKRGVRYPTCELCPSAGGIFKQTDSGRWVHMVCALYIQGVSFAEVEKLSGITLFELNYALWGSKSCTICEDSRLARTGICIGCDAGLCKTFFHVTCAQKEGLLFESHGEEVDPYFAHCRQHAEKTVMKQKRRTCLALQARLKRIQDGSLYVNTERTKKKLNAWMSKASIKRTGCDAGVLPPIPYRVSRMLMTSPAVILKLSRKSELLGLEPNSAFMSIADEMEAARRKWHIPPAFNLEFVAYVQDRTTRMASMKRLNTELVNQNAQLKLIESQLRTKYDNLKKNVDNLRKQRDINVARAEEIRKSIGDTNQSMLFAIDQLLLKNRNEETSQVSVNQPNYQVPNPRKRPASSKIKSRSESFDSACSSSTQRQSVSKSKSPASKSDNNKLSKNFSPPFKSPNIVPVISTHECGKCKQSKDQHLLSLCDTCKLFFHIYCLDPPLTRVPKKTKFGGWQCSDCSEKDDEEQEEAYEEQNSLVCKEPDGPRRLRERIKSPDKYTPEGMLMADLWARRNRNRRSKKKKSVKKVKLEPQ